MTLAKAISIFIDEYEWAKQQDWIKKPIAYAMYQAWKRVDETEGKK